MMSDPEIRRRACFEWWRSGGPQSADANEFAPQDQRRPCELDAAEGKSQTYANRDCGDLAEGVWSFKAGGAKPK